MKSFAFICAAASSAVSLAASPAAIGPIKAPSASPKLAPLKLPPCKLEIVDVKGLFPRTPQSAKRPAFDIQVRNSGKAACGAPGSGANFIMIESYSVDAYYRSPTNNGGTFQTKLQSHEENRSLPEGAGSLSTLDKLPAGQTGVVHIVTPNGYCAKPDPECVPDHAEFWMRLHLVYVPSGGKPQISPALEKHWSVLSASGQEYNVEKYFH